MSFWMPWRKKKRWDFEKVDFQSLWKAVYKRYKKRFGVNGLNVMDVGIVLNKYYYGFEGDVHEVAHEVLVIFKQINLAYESTDNQYEFGSKLHSTFWPVEELNNG